MFCQPTFSAEWDKSLPAGTTLINDLDSTIGDNNSAVDRLLANYREGMTLTYSSGSTIVVSSGEVVCSNAAGTVRKFRQNTSSTNVTFSDIDTGAEASATTYYVYANCDASATTATFKISASSTTPSGLTYYKRLGSFYNDSSSNITRINNDSVVNEIGEKESKTVDVSYQATSDGYVSYTGTFQASQQVALYTDSSSSPSTIVSQIATGASFVSTFRTGILYPIKAGDYYKISVIAGSPTTENYYFIPKN